jgi:hypothetical protein
VIVVLILVIIPAAVILIRSRKARAAEAGERTQRLDYQPSTTSIKVAKPVPAWRQAGKPRPAPVPAIDVTENCRDIQESLLALLRKYSLDSFTIATSDGLVFASSGGSTAQEDAAAFSGRETVPGERGVTLFGLDHKGSELTVIVRSAAEIPDEIQSRMENDTKDILNKWI